MFRNLMLASTAALLTLGTAGATLAQDKPVELRFSHWLPPQHPVHLNGMSEWAESVKEASGGSITVTIYPAQQLGQAHDHYDMARDGIADISFLSVGYQPGRFPIVAASELPFLISDARGGSAALDAWYRDYAATEMSDTRVCLLHFHSPGTLHSRTPIRVPSDLDGMNVRPANATIAAFVSALGGQNFQVSAPESREALERGIADAITFPWNSIMTFGIDPAVGYHLDMPLYTSAYAWVINPARYDELSDNQKQVIDDHCTSEWAKRVAVAWADEDDTGREKLLSLDGHEGVVPSPEEVELWREATAPLRERWAEGVKEVGLDPDEVFQALISKLEEHDSAY